MKGLSYDQLFPGRFIKAGEFDGKPVTLTIKDVFLDALETESGGEESKAIVTFEETKRQWVLIKTNAQCLVAIWGPDSGEWIGHKITLHAERDPSGLSDSGLCIRVKGSPELKKPMDVSIKLPRRKAVNRKLVPTKKAAADEPAFDAEEPAGTCDQRSPDICLECGVDECTDPRGRDCP